jgi:two-component system, OmpR family, sensor histidine kinase KdpD
MSTAGMQRRDNAELRPSPDAFLRQAQQAEQGHLKIFFGAAPEVGKTYDMLTAARVKKTEGVDVVVGVVETHGRKESEAVLQGLEIIPRRIIANKGHRLAEMDLDATLARRPSLVLVDELAHTNAPDGRHPKRYMDVEELPAAGIDVYTTLSIQRVESLNDIVTGITKVRVRETVPDSIIDRAQDVELSDLTPEDLIARLNDGKVSAGPSGACHPELLLSRESYGPTGTRIAPDGAKRLRPDGRLYAYGSN